MGSNPITPANFMKKDTNYIQCALMRENEHHMAWLPEKFAVVGKVIGIKNDDDTWQEGWEVVGVSGEIKKTSEEANGDSQKHKSFQHSIH